MEGIIFTDSSLSKANEADTSASKALKSTHSLNADAQMKDTGEHGSPDTTTAVITKPKKTIKCTCGKKVATPTALEQHKRMSRVCERTQRFKALFKSNPDKAEQEFADWQKVIKDTRRDRRLRQEEGVTEVKPDFSGFSVAPKMAGKRKAVDDEEDNNGGGDAMPLKRRLMPAPFWEDTSVLRLSLGV